MLYSFYICHRVSPDGIRTRRGWLDVGTFVCICVQKGKGSSVSSESYKSYKYWNKLSLLRLRSESVDLIARALML